MIIIEIRLDPNQRWLGHYLISARLNSNRAGLNDTFEACSWYRDNWTDGDRHIVRAVPGQFGGML